MKGITDIHSHILFKVDDGADSIETSLEILKREYQQGVNNVILTPHYDAGECMPETKLILEHFEQLQNHVKKDLPDMKLYLGNEIMSCNDMVELLDNKKLYSLAGSRYVLVEFFPSVQYFAMEKSLKELLNGGYIPIIAHCERYRCLRKTFSTINARCISHLVEMGVYMQVNVVSVFGRDRRFVAKMIDNDFLHFVASDAHNTGMRGVYWDKCLKYLYKKYDSTYIEKLLVKNPEKILKGEYI